MKDKYIYRLVAVQYLDQFKEKIKESKERLSIDNAIELLKKEGINEVPLPLSFENIIHKNLKYKFNDEIFECVQIDETFKYTKKVIKDITLDIKTIQNELLEIFSGIKNSSVCNEGNSYKYLQQQKKIAVISDRQTNIISRLLVNSWLIIKEYFPFDKYGLPTIDIIAIIMNMLLDNSIDIKYKDPYVNSNNDIYAILKDMEIKFLTEQLSKHGVNVNELKLKSGFEEEKEIIEKLINLNPVYSIIIYPNVIKNDIRKSSANIKQSITKLNKELETTQFDVSTKLNILEEYCKLYMDMRFNKCMSYSRISVELNKEGIYKDSDIVKKEITSICEATGLSELEKKIDRFNDYVRRDES